MSGETEKDISAWTIDSLRYHLEQIATDLDKRYEQRFQAQEKAVDKELAARDKETAAAFEAAEKAVDKALAEQKERVNKSESAYDKRFDAVNEFRGQLADQARQFLPRAEYLASHEALVDKVDANASRQVERISSLERRIEQMTGHDMGSSEARSSQRLDTGQVIALGAVVLAAVAIAVTLILALNS